MVFSKNSKTKKSFSRIISLILVHTFLLSSITLAAPQEKTPEQALKEIVTNPDNIVIPREFGLVKSKYNADSGKLVVHIQDAHCNYEAQSNIAKMLEALVKNDSLKLVSVEGADGVIDTSWFKAFPDDAVRKEVADYFMKKGEITGPEFLSITTDYPVKLFGAETRAYYLQNLNAFTSSYPLKAETEKYFNTIKAALNKLKGFIYSDELKLIDSKNAEYEAKKLQFNEYVRFLQAEAEKNKINLREYENLFKLINVLIYEKKIDFNVTDKERTDLIDTLTKKMPKEAITQLVAQSISFKIGKISSADYYNYLRNLAASNRVDLAKDYPNLFNYIIYNSVYSKIENEKLFHDITAIETAIKEKLFQNDDQRTLEKLSRHIDTLMGLVNIKLLNGDFDYYKNHKEEFANEAFADFIQKKAAQYGLAIEITPPADAVAKSITKLEDFYAIAIKRDKALVDNTLAEMNRQGQKIAVLVTGGFHSEGIAKLLEKQGISYMVVCPSITKDVPNPYIQVLTNQRTSFEDIVMGAAEPAQQGMLAPASIAWAIGLNEKEVRKVYQETNALTTPGEGSLDGKLEGRVLKVKEEWLTLHVTKWMERAFRYVGDNLHRLGQQEEVMRNAYVMALDYRLSEMVRSGTLTQNRADEVRARIMTSQTFADQFHIAFTRVQSKTEGNELVTQKPKDDSYRTVSAGLYAPAHEGDRLINKATGMALANSVVNRSMADNDTKFKLIFEDGKIPDEVQQENPEYAGLVKDLEAVIRSGFDESDIKDIIRAIRSTGEATTELEKAFSKTDPKTNKEVLSKDILFDALKQGSGLTIKLVQPKDQYPGLRVPGIAMSRTGSNYGHCSTREIDGKPKALYCAWGMVDALLAERMVLSRRIIIANLLHELVEYALLVKMFPDKSVASVYGADIIAHNVAERLERIIVRGKSPGTSALDEKLEAMTAEYFREYSRLRLDVAREIFRLHNTEVLYVARMWKQYIDRHIHNRGTVQLRLIKDRDILKNPDYDPLQHGNSLLAASLQDKEPETVLGMHHYLQLAEDPANERAAKNVVVIANSLDGGIGENVGRLKFLKNMAINEGIPPENVRMAAKGTDLGYFIRVGDREVFISIAEVKLLQLYIKLKSGIDNGSPVFSGVQIEPLVNYDSKKSYENLFNKICIFDVTDPASGRKRTYADLLGEVGVEIMPNENGVKMPHMLEQSDLPWIDKESGNILTEKLDKPKRRQPGGHGYWGFHFLYDAWKSPAPSDGKSRVRVFFNGDNVNSGIDEHIVGAMVKNNWPIVDLTTMAAPIDKKGGKIVVRIRNTGTAMLFIPDMMEEADAKKVGQVDEFHRAGLEGAEAGKQPFNTNMFYINITLVRSMLNDLVDQNILSEEELYDIICPALIAKDKEEMDAAGKKVVGEYAPIDGAFGISMYRLNELFLTNAKAKGIMKKHNVDRMLYCIDVPRTKFFTPVKKCFDMWLQMYSDYYNLPNAAAGWALKDSMEGLVPPEVDLKDLPLEDNDKKNYWNELQNLIDSLGHASTVGLESLAIHGRVIIRDAVLEGHVVIEDEVSSNEISKGNVAEAIDLHSLIDRNPKLKELYKDGRFVLNNVKVTIHENMMVDVVPIAVKTAKKVLRISPERREAMIRALAVKMWEDRDRAKLPGTADADWARATEIIDKQYPLDAKGVGAIRMAGGELTAGEHRGQEGVNAAIGSFMTIDNVRDGNVYALSRAMPSTAKPGDIEIELGPKNTSGLSAAQLSNLSSLMAGIQGKGISFIAIKGLKARLKVAADLIFHPGIGRRAVYIDEGDLFYLLSLPNGASLVMDAVKHEMAHINNPNLSEDEIEKMAPSYNVRIALMDRELSSLEDMARLPLTAAAWNVLAQKLMTFSQYIHTLPEAISAAADQDAKALFDRMLVRESVLARDVAGSILTLDDAGILEAIRNRADAMMVIFLDGQVAKNVMSRAKADSMLEGARTFLKEWLDRSNRIPLYMVQGIYRGMLEGRSADILYSFGAGWREFGTAGIRNPAMQSSFAATQQLELEEFAANPYAPILPGPNLIGAVTLLQQEASIALIMKDLQSRIKQGDPTLASLDRQFLKDVANNRVTIAYDSRIQGEYFAKLLAAAFLKDGIQVDLFDNAAGVPHLAWAANREHSAFGILISASHSEANYNGFKAFLGFQMSQVDKVSKSMIEDARKKVGYGAIRLDLASSETDLNALLRGSQGLRWVADNQAKGKDYLGKPLVPFYKWYYDLVKARSPIELLPEAVKKLIREKKASEALKVLYTAFFGVGAVPAANFPGFLNDSNYGNVDTVKAQTDVMNGMFPGHTSPDPGIVQGWVSNLVDYFTQHAGANLADIDKAIAALNEREVGVATDPDIDRAGIMIALPEGVRGNIKTPLIAAIEKYIEETDKIPQAAKQALTSQVTQAMRAGLNDKFLMTANDAWTFMMYWKLRMMEENGKLEKDRIYIIEKSHVTTSALERVAELYRHKGYKVYVVDTYVGFTEIGKKARDLFAIAKLSWDAYRTIEPTTGTAGALDLARLGEIIKALKKANTELKANVPYQTAGLPIVDETINLLEKIQAQPSVDLAIEAMGLLNALSRMHILAGVEESNGYGELGRWNRDTQSVELNHISDKDGSLAAFEFLEILSYGKYLSNKTAYDMYQDLTKDIGMVCTVNSALYHPGLTGVIEKLNEIEALEKLFAYTLQQRLNRGEKVELFNGRYTVTKVEVYRDEKYDNNFLGFAEEGIRLYVTTKAGSEVIVTYRPSGTGDSNRDYNWLLGPKPAPGADFEEYRKAIEDEMEVMVRDFFGIDGREKGYADLPPGEFYGLLMALKEGGLQKQSEVIGKAFSQGPLALTDTESNLYKAVAAYALAARKGAKDTATLAETSRINRQAWVDYLASPEVAEAPDRVPFEVSGKVVARIPKAAMIAWQAGLVDYLIGLIVKEGPTATFSIPDGEIATLIGKRMPEGFRKEALKPTELPLPKPEAPSMADKEKAPKKTPVKATGKGAEASRKAEESSARQNMYDKYVQGDERALQSTLVTISAVDENNRKPAIIAYDTGMDPQAGAAIRKGEAVVNEYLGGTVVVVRGTGKALYEKLKLASSAMANKFQREIAIVTIVGDETLAQIDSELDREAKSRKEALGNIINVAKNGKNKYVPVIALYDVALRWAYGLDLEQVADRLSRIADPNGSHIAMDDLLKGIIRIMPRIGPVNTAEAVEAYRAAQQALQSL